MGPSRRPSAAGMIASSASVASSSRVHRSQDSHYGGSQNPRNEQQKKIVQVLTQRLRLLVRLSVMHTNFNAYSLSLLSASRPVRKDLAPAGV